MFFATSSRRYRSNDTYGIYEGPNQMSVIRRQLVLNKGSEKYLFRYDDGMEDLLLDALIDQAEDKRTDFDWFDAAVLSFKLTQALISQANDLLSEKKDVQLHANES